MTYRDFEDHEKKRPRQGMIGLLVAAVLLVLLGARTIAGFTLEYQWWKEVDQLPTWFDILIYSVSPVVIGAIFAFTVFWLAHARGLKFAGTGLRHYPFYAKMSTLGLFLLAVVVATATIDTWTVVRYFGGLSLPATAGEWTDPVFGWPLGFYFFSLPFYSVVLRLLLVTCFLAAILYWLTARLWQLRSRFPEFREGVEFDFNDLRLVGALESRFIRGVGVLFLVGLAAWFFLNRYTMLLSDHGFLVGVDYVDQNIRLPLQWLGIAVCLFAAAMLWAGRLVIAAGSIAVVLVLQMAIPGVVSTLYVRPSEISLERPYIERHIQATRSAFGFGEHTREVEFGANLETKVDPVKHKALLDNVRLWDWRAFHDTITQIQALRPYYVFNDTDVDRYTIDGELRQVMLSPRELDVRQLGNQGSTRWINSHFIYTHGYGLVTASANRITAEGLPVLFTQDAPPVVHTESLKLTRPEIYFGEVTHDPVFVRTAQPEFDYPSGSDNVHARYAGNGGFPVSSLPMRTAAALANGDWKVLLTTYLKDESRMMMRRKVRDRVSAMAGFVAWDPDPYLVITDAGRLVWMIDGYTTSNSHPYSRGLQIEAIGGVNYIRNSVKATVDAYDGTVRMYIFDPADPIIQAYSNLFPKLLLPRSEMPEDLQRHARYPELLFRTQAEIYRTYHMRDPEAFYNNEDLWNIARNVAGQGARPEPVTPIYMVATLPGETEPEFLLMIPFTPRNKDNMVGLMVARCDKPNLGELVVLQLSKQELVYGPMQIEARITQDQNISKDLSLWNQQGARVLRGQMLVLPVEDSFLYVEPIYIQAEEARMPQLKKVVVAMGNRLIYTDTYEQAVTELLGGKQYVVRSAAAAAESAPPAQQPAAQPGSPPPAADAELNRRLENVRSRMRRYRELMSQGKWSEAGRELESIEQELQRR